VIGSFSSCLLLFGFALLYISSGSLSFEAIQKVYVESDQLNIIFYAICFSSGALLFKVGAAPFHTWLCDVYEGSLTSVTLFFATVPKVILFYLFLKLFFYVLLTQEDIWTSIILGSGVLSVVVASVGALVQKKVKRLLAFSAVSHAGFILLAISCNSLNSVKACTFYLIFYIIMNLSNFSIIFSSVTQSQFLKYLVNWSSQTVRNSLIILTFTLTLFSIAGIPPLGGFYSKLLVFSSLIGKYHSVFTVIVAFFSCIACFYYIRLIKMFFFTGSPKGFWIAQPFRFVEICLALTTSLIIFILAHPDFVLSTSNLVACSMV
jgi:NADH-quinone oxidoreductase subunit N